MKKIIFTAALLASCISFQLASAQIRFHVNLNIGSQPDWGPVGYDHADYYYMPDVDAYYDVPNHQYVYFENNVWVHRPYLPARYRGYDMYHGYKVVINQPNPWLRGGYYRTHYASFRGRRDQAIIRDSRDARYANHWRESGRGPGGHDNGFHNGGGHDNGFHDGGHGGDHGNGGHDNGHGGSDHGNGGDHGHGGDHGGGHGHGRP